MLSQPWRRRRPTMSPRRRHTTSPRRRPTTSRRRGRDEDDRFWTCVKEGQDKDGQPWPSLGALVRMDIQYTTVYTCKYLRATNELNGRRNAILQTVEMSILHAKYAAWVKQRQQEPKSKVKITLIGKVQWKKYSCKHTGNMRKNNGASSNFPTIKMSMPKRKYSG